MRQHRIAKERSGHRTLGVEAGQVACPRQGILDVERCWVCPAYGGLSAGRIEGVICNENLADLRFVPHPAVQ
jgi:hypothetical protein